MVLARVTSEPPTCVSLSPLSCPFATAEADVLHTDILLGGDASHSRDLYLPVPSSPTSDARSPLPVIDGKPQLATDPPLATYTIGQLTRMSAEDEVKVVLAHEGEADGVVDQYPQRPE